jgi:hypothetical protein
VAQWAPPRVPCTTEFGTALLSLVATGNVLAVHAALTQSVTARLHTVVAAILGSGAAPGDSISDTIFSTIVTTMAASGYYSRHHESLHQAAVIWLGIGCQQLACTMYLHDGRS